MNPQFVQIPCGKCGTTVWISPAAGVGYCPSCHTPNSIPPGGAQAQQPSNPGGYAAPQQQQQPGAPVPYQGAVQAPVGMQGQVVAYSQPKRPPIGLIIGGVLLVGAGSVAFGFLKSYIFKPKGTASVKSDLGTDPKKADPDKVIEKTKELARKWRPDAEFMGATFQGIKPDGTTDFSDKNAEIDFYSPSRATQSSISQRSDAVKKFLINDDRVDYTALWDATNQWAKEDPINPKCTIAKLVKAMGKKGFKSGTALVSFDPKKAMAWHTVAGDDSKWWDLDSCEELKPTFGDDNGGGGGDDGSE